MANNQTYNQFTKCVDPANYSGPFLGSTAFWALIASGIVLALPDPGAVVVTLLLGIIGYCRWWLYGRLACLGGNECFIGLALRIDTQEDQSGPADLGKFDTDYSVYVLPAPNPLYGDPNVISAWSTEIAATNPIQGNLLIEPTGVSGFEAMKVAYGLGFQGEPQGGRDMAQHDGVPGPLTQAQLDARNLPNPPDWQANHYYTPGDKVRDSNGNIQNCTAYSGGLSGPNPPSWGTVAGGPPVSDGALEWAYGGPVPAVAALEVEFEGAGVWDLYQFALAAMPIAVTAAVVCPIPIIGWVVCLVLTLIALAIATVGAVLGLTDNSAKTQATTQAGDIQPLKSILFVMGKWVYDTGHSGWNELHPVLFCQIIDCISQDDLNNGLTWENFPKYSLANIENTVAGLCALAHGQLAPQTPILQAQPQNSWTLHPLVDGCTPNHGTPPLS